jgi:hypothetical protein
VRGQQPGNEPDQFRRDIEHDTIGDHAEPLPVDGDLQRDLFYRGLRVFPGISAYVRVSTSMPSYVPSAGFTLAGKTSLSRIARRCQDGTGKGRKAAALIRGLAVDISYFARRQHD